MKEKMWSLFCFVTVLVGVSASGEFVVLHSPDSVTFHGSEKIEQSLLKEVFAAALGFTVKQRGTWGGMSITDPFALPEAVVCIAVEGINSLHIPNGKKFPLEVDEVEETTWQAVSGRLEERDNDNTLVRIYLADGLDALGQSALGELKPSPINESSLKALSLQNEEDHRFLEEVELLRAIAKKVPTAIKADSKPDVYWLVVSGLRPVFDLHGKNSSAAKEALQLLNDPINAVSEAFINVYDGKVLITTFTNDATQVRHTRSILPERQRRDTKQGEDEEKKVKEEEDIDTSNDSSTSENYSDTGSTEHTTEYSSTEGDSGSTENSDQDFTKTENKIDTNTISIGQDLHLAKDYSPNYPVMFNIFLWFGVVFVFSLIAICVTIADMDPGRDSIIYRMTSNRMKKDN